MKSNESQCKDSSSYNGKGQRSPSKSKGDYHKVLDGRKRPIRGLWQRNGRFYARMTVEDAQTGAKKVQRIPLDAQTVGQAQEEMRRLLTQRSEDRLPAVKQAPKFDDYVGQYLAFYETVRHAKRERTLATERIHLKQWVEHLGSTRLNRITRPMIHRFIEKRQAQGVTGRTINLAVIVLRNVLNRAVDEGWLKSLPTENLRPLKWSPRKKRLFRQEEIDRICQAALETSKNGVQVADYIRLMAYCGSRMTETLRLKWSDVDWDIKQLTIGADGQSKNRKARVVDFNAKLEDHLRAMWQRRAPDSEWLFPSPQRGKVDRAARTFRETLLSARKRAGVNDFGFHDCRHFFISYCVMSGIDYMTIARWVGHQDGGILIGQVYGHLSNEHAKRQAGRIQFD